MTQSEEPEYTYKAGTIKSITLNNFMCHESFSLDLGPKVNFIIGPNGSGKSALLTALVVVLGGRATVTSRGKRTNAFVMYGKNSAKISVVLHNYSKVMDKAQAFKPDDYGRNITVEKIIYQDGVSKLVLKNEHNKKVSERASELHEMLDHFGILINNPICILNQEVSKTFLHSKRPEDKFDLFMKATNLEQIEEDYNAAQGSHSSWDETNSKTIAKFKILDHEYNACEEKRVFLINRAKLNDQLADLSKELFWAKIRDTEKSTDELSEKISNIDKLIEETQKKIDARNAKIKTYQEEIQFMNNNIQTVNDNLNDAKQKLDGIKSEEIKMKSSRIELKGKIDQCQRNIQRRTNDKSGLEKSIEELKKQFRDQNTLDQDNEQRKLEIERLERELKADHAREKSTRLLVDQISKSMTAIRTDLLSANAKTNTLKDKIFSSHNVLRRLKNGQENGLRRYGDFVVKLRDEIEKAFKQGKFIRKPIGPLGYFLKLKCPDVAGPLEIHLGKNAHAFACDNHQDMTTLSALCKRLSTIDAREFRAPTIITRSFKGRFDVSSHKAVHSQFKTLLDHIDIEEDAVYNALVDRTSLESVLFVPNYSDAENLMIDPASVPRNTRCAYTKCLAVMHPRTVDRGYKSFSNSHVKPSLFNDNNGLQIKEMEREIDNLNAELRSAEFLAQGIQGNLNEQRKEYDSNNIEIRKLVSHISKTEDTLLNLKTMIVQEPQELSALESELEKIEVQLEEEKVNLEQFHESLKTIDSEVEDVVKRKEAVVSLLRKHEEKKKGIQDIIDGTKTNVHEAERVVKDCTVVIENKQKDKEELTKSLEEGLERLARNKLNVDESEKPRKIRNTDVVDKERRKIETQIRVDQEENRDPEELIQSLRKRMEEIERLSELKEANLSNFATSTDLMRDRREGFKLLRHNTIGQVGSTFTMVMRSMKMNGRIEIYLEDLVQDGEIVRKAKTLEMQIDTHYTPSQRVGLVANDLINNQNGPQSQPCVSAPRAKRARRESTIPGEKENDMKLTDARSLSGGERSFSTVAFVLALWHHCKSPFKLMDEIDVFMDMVTRRVSYNALISFARVMEDTGQFIFFSPLELPQFDNGGTSVRVFEMPSIIRKPVESQNVPASLTS